MMSAFFKTCLALGMLTTAVPAQAHEFWISPGSYQVAPGTAITLTTRVGENFKGGSGIYNPNRFARYDAFTAAGEMPVTGRIGDNPVTLDAPEGLVTVVHETLDLSLRYTDPAKWQAFVDHKAFDGAMARHAARGLPDAGFVEAYRRFAKSLVAVGDGAGFDRQVGLRTEILALDNPYTTDRSSIRVQVFLQNAPRVNAQVEIFDKAPDGTVTVSLTRTDGRGMAVVPVTPGHSYLVDAVTLVETANNDPAAGPVWQSLWAALTFAVP